jgi:hypothetical protein
MLSGEVEVFLEEEFWGFLDGERVFVGGFGAEGFDLRIYVVGVFCVPAGVALDLVYVVV